MNKYLFTVITQKKNHNYFVKFWISKFRAQMNDVQSTKMASFNILFDVLQVIT